MVMLGSEVVFVASKVPDYCGVGSMFDVKNVTLEPYQ